MKQHSLPQLKLPRHLESDPRHKALEKLLTENQRPLWSESDFGVPHLPLTPALEKSLSTALSHKRLERGLEHILQKLDSEERGLAALREKQGTPPANRVSRLMVISNDGTERFYRECGHALLHHGHRLLCLKVEADSERLSLNLFGPGKPVKALLISDKEAVINVLLSLIPT